MTNQNTITVELPIKAEDGGYVRVFGIRWAREYWREFAADPSIALSEQTRVLAPAVVAWIERDEWKPLDLPVEGRTIKATLRDGRVETFKVGRVGTGVSGWAYVSKADSYYGERYIQRTPDVDDPSPIDIIAWEYVDEPAKPAISVEQLSVMAQFIEDRCFCGSCGTGEEHARKVLAKAGLAVAGESQ